MAFDVDINTTIILHTLLTKVDLNFLVTTPQMLSYFSTDRINNTVQSKVHW